jgi:hypothetical protein
MTLHAAHGRHARARPAALAKSALRAGGRLSRRRAWTATAERGSLTALFFIRWFYHRRFGRRASVALLTPIVALEESGVRTPYQWFNFFEFWRNSRGMIGPSSVVGRTSLTRAQVLTFAYAAATAGTVGAFGFRH